MTIVNVAIDCTLPAEEYEGILDTAGYVISYWACQTSIEPKAENSDEVIYRVTEDETGTEYVLDKSKVEQAIADIITDRRWACDRFKPLKNAILNQEYGEIDGDLADIIIQTACFGEVVYG
ncbi:MAG: hypothetical protein ACO208_07970 [Candidatus Puniceispirillaceae bacterium]